jgi:hypothetical protein
MLRTRKQKTTPLGAVLRGLVAGAAGTAAMTTHQEIRQRLARRDPQTEEDGSTRAAGGEENDPWQSAPAPAQVGKRLIEGVFGRHVSPAAIPVLTQAMHWSYGSAWGGVYALGRESSCAQTRLLAPCFGLGVWAASYFQLVPLGIYEPPWTYPLSSLADDVSYHLTYGTAVAASYELLSRRAAR